MLLMVAPNKSVLLGEDDLLFINFLAFHGMNLAKHKATCCFDLSHGTSALRRR